MIGRLVGTLVYKQPPWLLLDVGGVGYEIEAPMSTFYRLPEAGSKITLHTHMVVREDAQLLYGFDHEDEKILFRALLKISGVGPKVALAVLSGMGVEEFREAVQDGDSARLTRTPGIGKKTAERIVVEMRDRLPGIVGGGNLKAVLSGGGGAAPQVEARAALESLGYKSQEAKRLVESVCEKDMTTDAIIREALKRAVR